MTDAVVAVRQAETPDRNVDNDRLTNTSGTTVYRQRVASHAPVEEQRFDYDARTDGRPVYAGAATPGAATSASSWTIRKYTYDGSDRVTRIQVAVNVAWDDRTTSF